MSMDFIIGRNSVLEALKAKRSINKILLLTGSHEGSIKEIVALAREQKLKIEEVKIDKLNELTDGAKHQGILAYVPPVAYAELEDLFDIAKERGEEPFFVLLDEVQDPQNVGAILRTANATGVHGVLLTKKRSCPLTVAVAKASAGAVEYVPVVQIGNVAQTLEKLKKLGLWVVGAEMTGENCFQADLRGPIVLVLGNEGEGIGRLVKEKCDFLVSIPMKREIASLNVSVAGAIVMYQVFTQRSAKFS